MDLVGASKLSGDDFFFKIIDAVQDGIAIIGRDMRIVCVNKWMNEIFGSAGLAGQTCYEAFHGGQAAPCEGCAVRRAMDTGEKHTVTRRLDPPGRPDMWVEMTAHPLVEGGVVVGAVQHVRDITQRKRAQDALDFERSQLTTIFESVDEVVYVSDPRTYEILYANKAMRDRFPDTVIGGACYKALQHRDEPCPFCTNKIIMENGGAAYQWDFYNPAVGRHFAITDRIIRWPDGRDVRFEIAKDITHRKEYEAELAEAKERAELYVDLMGHDINNMNQVAMGYLEMLQSILDSGGSINNEQAEMVRKPYGMLQNSSRLIDNVRKLQKRRQGGYESRAVDVGEVIEEAMDTANTHDRDVIVRFDERVRCTVVANDLLKDVFVNILGNSIKHSTGPLHIDITMDTIVEDREYCRVSVEDDGPGIPDHKKTDLFTRLKPGSRRTAGNGFGTYIMKTMVGDYGGQIRVDDRVQGDHTKGTKITVLLPRTENATAIADYPPVKG